MSKSRIIQVGAVLDGAARKKDGSISLRFVTNKELSTEEYMVIDTYRQAMGWLLFKENEFKEEEIPEEDTDEDIAKSQSIQLRDSLWVLYRARGGNGADKEAWGVFYKKQMQFIKARVLQEVHELDDKNA